MCAQWRGGYDPQSILDKLLAEISNGDSCGFDSSRFAIYQTYTPTLVSAVQFHPDIPESEKERIVANCLKAALERRVLKSAALRDRIRHSDWVQSGRSTKGQTYQDMSTWDLDVHVLPRLRIKRTVCTVLGKVITDPTQGG